MTSSRLWPHVRVHASGCTRSRSTGSACSSSSARPVRRTKCRISPSGFVGDFCIGASLASTSAAASFDASSDEPGGRVTLTWTLPSSNGGRKSAPSRGQLPAADADQHPGRAGAAAGPAHAEADQVAGHPLQQPQQEAVAARGASPATAAAGSTTAPA